VEKVFAIVAVNPGREGEYLILVFNRDSNQWKRRRKSKGSNSFFNLLF